MPSRRAAGSAEGTGNWNVTYFGSETSYGSSAAPRNLQSKFDCKKYVQHYMFRYNQKSSIGAPRWEPNDRKRVRPDAVECPTRLDRTRLRSKRGAPKGRVEHSITRACGRSRSATNLPLVPPSGALILVGWVSFTLRQNNGASSYQTKHRASPEGVPFKLFAFGTEVCSKCGDLLDFGNRGFSE